MIDINKTTATGNILTTTNGKKISIMTESAMAAGTIRHSTMIITVSRVPAGTVLHRDSGTMRTSGALEMVTINGAQAAPETTSDLAEVIVDGGQEVIGNKGDGTRTLKDMAVPAMMTAIGIALIRVKISNTTAVSNKAAISGDVKMIIIFQEIPAKVMAEIPAQVRSAA